MLMGKLEVTTSCRFQRLFHRVCAGGYVHIYTRACRPNREATRLHGRLDRVVKKIFDEAWDKRMHP